MAIAPPPHKLKRKTLLREALRDLSPGLQEEVLGIIESADDLEKAKRKLEEKLGPERAKKLIREIMGL
ncbi:MAG: hypothetical protein DRN96_01370 [Thermoproteota archaeon]|nr:MAG: hypothetical protein DRN96_01370 [Candidatus Korarchaeota archaeon]RLG55342.1 MAG: hypothetical protein DRN99_02880 [Candidatus Korarchaeota archaeon]